MLTWQGSGGFSVDAAVRIEAEDRAGIERVRYCARPPFALERLHALDSAPALASPESRLLYRFPKPDVNGRTELLLTPLELLEALAKFVPPGTDAKRWSRPSSPLSRCPCSERQATAPRRGVRSARSACARRGSRFTRHGPRVGARARLPCPNPLGRPARPNLRRAAAAVLSGTSAP